MNPRRPAIRLAIPLLLVAAACSTEWPAYRHDPLRRGIQPNSTPLSDWASASALAVGWQYPPAGSAALPGGFRSSPIVVNNTVYIGSRAGHFYAIDATTGTLKWQYPTPPAALFPSDGAFGYGIASSATYAALGPNSAVIFGAQDPDLGPYGNARLFALDASTGVPIWKSDTIAQITGDHGCNMSELHEKIGYSSPLVFNNLVYVGVSDHGDDPIQQGKVRAVNLADGTLAAGFQFKSVPDGTRGGAVWNAPATDLTGVYFTTGNARTDGCPSSPYSEPSPNHSLSMIRVDKDTGAIVWAFQPVPFALDEDPDWSAGAAIMLTSCGTLAASVQKDGYAYAVDVGDGTAGPPNVKWQFPPTGFPFTGGHHGDDDYKRPGAAWNDVLVITAGGEALVADGVGAGYGRLHALNACATTEATRVRWLLDVPSNKGFGYSLGAPTVSGGIVYLGTDKGHLIVVADPATGVAPSGFRCSHIDYADAASCTAAGYVLVPIPVVKDIPVTPDGSSLAGMRNEPALANGRVYVASDDVGRVYMLAPPTTAPAVINACGGTIPLTRIPETSCLEAGSCGRWKCLGKDAVTCNTTLGAKNECGGCNPLPISESGYGKGSPCICNNPAKSEGILVCGPPKNGITPLICCPCDSAPGCGPGSP